MKRRTLLALAATTMMVGAAFAPAKAEDAVKIGMVAELSGAGAPVGANWRDGLKLAVEEIKRVVLTGMDMPLEAALKLEMRSAYLLFGTADKGEAMRAFLEKRPAVFTGK